MRRALIVAGLLFALAGRDHPAEAAAPAKGKRYEIEVLLLDAKGKPLPRLYFALSKKPSFPVLARRRRVLAEGKPGTFRLGTHGGAKWTVEATPQRSGRKVLVEWEAESVIEKRDNKNEPLGRDSTKMHTSTELAVGEIFEVRMPGSRDAPPRIIAVYLKKVLEPAGK